MDKEAIRKELNNVRDEIKKLKSDFFGKKDEKEKFFSQGEEFSTEINSLYEEIKKIEQENSLDKINVDLEEKKKELEELQLKVDEAQKDFEVVKKNGGGTSKGTKPVIRTVSVEKAKKEIKQLDTKLQTQVLSLEKESEVIKKITELKGLVSEHGGSDKSHTTDEFKKVKTQLNSLRRKYSNTERKIRSLYKQIRLISKEKKKRYKRIDDLRALKKKAFEDFRLNKKDYSGIGKDLKGLFKKEEELLVELGESPDQRKRQSDKDIKKKRQEIEDKFMKKGGTLTTEDLLLFQSKK